MSGKIIIEFDDKGNWTEAVQGNVAVPAAIVALGIMKIKLEHNLIALQAQRSQQEQRRGLVMPDGTPVRTN